MHEFSGSESKHPFRNIIPEETKWSHELFTAALESNKTGRKIIIDK
jgi:hypothetical protein